MNTDMRIVRIRKELATKLKIIASTKETTIQELASRIIEAWIMQHASIPPKNLPVEEPTGAEGKQPAQPKCQHPPSQPPAER